MGQLCQGVLVLLALLPATMSLGCERYTCSLGSSWVQLLGISRTLERVDSAMVGACVYVEDTVGAVPTFHWSLWELHPQNQEP